MDHLLSKRLKKSPFWGVSLKTFPATNYSILNFLNPAASGPEEILKQTVLLFSVFRLFYGKKNGAPRGKPTVSVQTPRWGENTEPENQFVHG